MPWPAIRCHLSVLSGSALTTLQVNVVRELMDRHVSWIDVDRAHLAHGDFDMTHIYQEDGRYTGIIDFGEIRGCRLSAPRQAAPAFPISGASWPTIRASAATTSGSNCDPLHRCTSASAVSMVRAGR
jgi:hypothetical protein